MNHPPAPPTRPRPPARRPAARPPARRLDGLGESVFSAVTRAAQEAGAINLSQGFPDYDISEWIFPYVDDALRRGLNQYAPAPGTPELREAVAAYQRRRHGVAWRAGDEVTVVDGATEGIFATVQALVDPGDEVVVFEPFYDSYVAAIRMAGGIPVPVTLHAPDFRFDPARLAAAFTPRTRLVVLNNPHNPSGRVFERADLESVAELALRHDVDVLADEVYEFLVYDGNRHVAFAGIDGMRERTVTVSSMSKTFGLTGWKVGWCCAPPRLTAALRTFHQYNVFCVAHPLQAASAAALDAMDDRLRETVRLHEGKRDLLAAGLSAAGFGVAPAGGACFILARLPEALLAEGVDDVAANDRMIRDLKVAAIPPSVFYLDSTEGRRMLRFCFAKRDEVLAEAVRRLRAGARP